MAAFGDGYLKLIAVMSSTPMTRREIADAMGVHPRQDSHVAKYLARHCEPQPGMGLKSLFSELAPSKKRPASKLNPRRWKLSAAGTKLKDKTTEAH